MFIINHKVFLVESYFGRGVKLENCEWLYSLRFVLKNFLRESKNFPTTYDSR